MIKDLPLWFAICWKFTFIIFRIKISKESSKIISQEECLNALRDLKKKEKEFSKARDELTCERQKLPWVNIEKDYFFDGPKGKVSLGEKMRLN